MKTILFGLGLLLLAACSRTIPPEIREALDKEFEAKALDSGWRFIKVTHGFGGKELVADILVSAPIEGAGEAVQRETLRRRVCPGSGRTDLWQHLRGYKLSVVAYTQDRKFTVLADCVNPLAGANPAEN